MVNVVNAANRAKPARKLMQKTLAVHPEARLPEYRRPTTRAKLSARRPKSVEPQAAGPTCGRVAVFSTCYGNFNHPAIVEDLVAVFEHNDIPVRLLDRERCCGMPKLELGDLETVQRAKEENVAELKALIDDGWDIVAPIPSCVLMFKQELPLLFPEDADVAAVRNRMFDPFEYLALRHKHGKLNTSFAQSLGTVAYHVACHQRVQKIGPRTQELLSLVPETRVEVIERCAGQDGTYGFKDECHSIAMKIARPIVNRVKQAQVDHLTSDCAMAGEHIAYGVGNGAASKHPLTLLRIAYGI